MPLPGAPFFTLSTMSENLNLLFILSGFLAIYFIIISIDYVWKKVLSAIMPNPTWKVINTIIEKVRVTHPVTGESFTEIVVFKIKQSNKTKRYALFASGYLAEKHYKYKILKLKVGNMNNATNKRFRIEEKIV